MAKKDKPDASKVAQKTAEIAARKKKEAEDAAERAKQAAAKEKLPILVVEVDDVLKSKKHSDDGGWRAYRVTNNGAWLRSMTAPKDSVSAKGMFASFEEMAQQFTKDTKAGLHEYWQEIDSALQTAGTTAIRVGVLLLKGEQTYGITYEEVADRYSWAASTLRTYVSVARAIGTDLLEKYGHLGIGKMQQVTAVPKSELPKLLEQASKENWDRDLLRNKAQELAGPKAEGSRGRPTKTAEQKATDKAKRDAEKAGSVGPGGINHVQPSVDKSKQPWQDGAIILVTDLALVKRFTDLLRAEHPDHALTVADVENAVVRIIRATCDAADNRQSTPPPDNGNSDGGTANRMKGVAAELAQ